jgi:hypothetical protein
MKPLNAIVGATIKNSPNQNYLPKFPPPEYTKQDRALAKVKTGH